MNAQLTVEVYFDLICPWCLIGSRNLHAALAELRSLEPGIDAEILWHSVPLLPDIPNGGVPYDEFYLRRLGSREAIAARRAQVQATARNAGLAIQFDRIRMMPSTLPGHRLIAAAAARQLPLDALIDRLFVAYFLEGQDIGSLEVLTRIGSEYGLDADTVADCYNGRAGQDFLTTGTARHAVNGVPFYVINRRFPVSGAVSAAVLLDAARKSLVLAPH
ncbi:Putative DsbA family dithiol-disulfide isomerase [Georgfuchsia toluolica]|uniref:DsbA family dithiol-disulfide isomerase n=1 Tax=Georgfuchsia toluolica TaxID=424218 RepID=A0A916NHR5_9PROT|nr:DsbA family oxidoreductase [Georgfuchsia toluolica]CAG4883676.1 Putative DsbA family dithiol-disulfide isomerase [Georgfuchsia toluolica]